MWKELESARGLVAVAAVWGERLVASSKLQNPNSKQGGGAREYEVFKAGLLQRHGGMAEYYPCPRGCGCAHRVFGVETLGKSSVLTSALASGGGEGEEMPRRILSRVRHGGRHVEMGEGSASQREARHLEMGQTGASQREARHLGMGEGGGSQREARHLWHLYRGVCQCEEACCPDIELELVDLELWELSWSKLARGLCQALMLDYKSAEVGLLNTRQIGSWSDAGVPVILTIQHERAWFRTVVLELVARLKTRFILLAPTARHLDAASAEILGNARAEFFALENIVRMSANGQFESAVTPGKLFASFAPAPADEEAETARKAIALIRSLDEECKKPPLVTAVFHLYCVEGLSVSKVAKRCRCSRGTVRGRLELLQERTQLHPDRLRQMSGHFEKIDEEIAGSRAGKVFRRKLIYDEDG